MRRAISLVKQYLGLSNEELASRVGCTVRTLNKWATTDEPPRLHRHYWAIIGLYNSARNIMLQKTAAERRVRKAEWDALKCEFLKVKDNDIT